MIMMAGISLTPGSVMFLAGILILAAAVVMSLATALTAGRRKRKMDEKMKEIY